MILSVLQYVLKLTFLQVGDRLDTDVLWAEKCRMGSLLVLTGTQHASRNIAGFPCVDYSSDKLCHKMGGILSEEGAFEGGWVVPEGITFGAHFKTRDSTRSCTQQPLPFKKMHVS